MNKKYVCQLDADGYYVGLVVADESPLEPGKYLVPGGCIETAQPALQLGQRARWTDDDWEIEDIPPTPEPEPDALVGPPSIVTMRQARLALLAVDLLDNVDAAIAAIPNATQRRAAQIEWEYAQTVDRNSSFTQQMAIGLALSAEQLDNLFTQAAQL